MSYLVLARKYRPRSFAQMVGQEHVVQALTNALTQQRLHHAYLFTGTRGVGKTTVSRILAKSLNCLGPDGTGGITATPCGVCAACTAIDAGRFVDYTELDAASNRSVEEVQSLLEQAVYKPVEGRFKVFMIDEVHMLTGHAFNAMLKTLEEPPEYVKFVLATTDPQKIPVTVLSRCLQFHLRPMAPDLVEGHLAHVLTQEGIAYERGALRLLAQAARGSMRDALSLTDQAIAFGGGAAAGLQEGAIRQMLGTVDARYVLELVDALASGNGQQVVAIADALRHEGLSAGQTLEDMARVLQRMAVYQLAQAQAPDDDAHEQAIAQLATRLPPDETQLLYSLCVQGRAELGLAPDEHAGLVMSLLRLLAFKPQDFKPPQAQALPAAEKKSLKTPEPAGAPASAAPASTSPLAAARPAAASTGQAAEMVPPTAKLGPQQPAASHAPSDAPGNALSASSTAASVSAHEPESPSPSGAVVSPEPVLHAILPLPVREMPQLSQLDVAAQSQQVDAQAHAQWLELVQALHEQGQLSALVRELALQSECVQAGEGWRTLRVEQTALRADSVREKLQALVSKHTGRDCLLRVELGSVSDSLARRQQLAQAQQQDAAEAQFRNLPVVQALLHDFGGRVVAGSVKPLPAAPR